MIVSGNSLAFLLCMDDIPPGVFMGFLVVLYSKHFGIPNNDILLFFVCLYSKHFGISNNDILLFFQDNFLMWESSLQNLFRVLIFPPITVAFQVVMPLHQVTLMFMSRQCENKKHCSCHFSLVHLIVIFCKFCYFSF